MQSLDGGGFVCDHCGHSARPREHQFRCSCSHCRRAAEGVALLAEAVNGSASDENAREIEILHSLTLLTFEEAMQNDESKDGAVDKRQLEIKKQLVALYEQQKAFSHPTPAEQPADYEPEELESWANLKARIDRLENELAKISQSEGA